jgi:repressor LexA
MFAFFNFSLYNEPRGEMMKDLKPKQQEILDYINNYLEDYGYPPTVREIGKAVQLKSSSSVHSQLNKLEELGHIRKSATASRAISVVSSRQNIIDVPVLGMVTAGNPIEAIESVSHFFPIPATTVKASDTLFMLTVKGDSMVKAAILEGDYILVKKTDVCDNGEIVVAMTDDNEVTVKRFFKEKDYFRLQPENDDYDPIILKDVTIVGKVIGVYRDLV